MFIHTKTIYLHETDATGVLFFSEQFKIAGEALETYFLHQSFSLHQLIKERNFLMPIVHAQANFLQPLHVGDQIEILVELEKIGESSFTICSRFYCQKSEVGNTKIVHVVVSKETKKSIPVPHEVQQLLQGLSSFQRSGMENEHFGDFVR